MRRTLLVPGCMLLLAAATAAPATAITNGDPDGNLHPHVGAIVADWTSASPGPGCDVLGHADQRHGVPHRGALHRVPGGERSRHPRHLRRAVRRERRGARRAGRRHRRRAPPVRHGGTSDPHDIAVVLLAESPGIAPAELPVAGLLDDLHAAHALDDATFTAVGYGETRTDHERRLARPGAARRPPPLRRATGPRGAAQLADAVLQHRDRRRRQLLRRLRRPPLPRRQRQQPWSPPRSTWTAPAEQSTRPTGWTHPTPGPSSAST